MQDVAYFEWKRKKLVKHFLFSFPLELEQVFNIAVYEALRAYGRGVRGMIISSKVISKSVSISSSRFGKKKFVKSVCYHLGGH